MHTEYLWRYGRSYKKLLDNTDERLNNEARKKKTVADLRRSVCSGKELRLFLKGD